jgi:hypothetical protein
VIHRAGLWRPDTPRHLGALMVCPVVSSATGRLACANLSPQAAPDGTLQRDRGATGPDGRRIG